MFKRQSGLTLIEIVASIVIIAIGSIGVAAAITNGLGRSGEVLVQLRAVALAQSYLDEALGKRYDERTRNRGVPPCRDPALPGVPAARRCTLEANFGPDTGETPGTYSRVRFDDVDDYHGVDEGNGGANTMVDAEGNPRTDYDAFRVEIEVRYINLGISVPADTEESGLPVNNEYDDEYDGKLIIVRITDGGLAGPVEYSAFKSNF